MAIEDEVAAAMKAARKACGNTPEQFARELTRMEPRYPVTARDVKRMEAGTQPVLAVHFTAAARLAEQPVSSLLGELTAYTTLASLERRIGELEARWEAAKLS